MTAKIYAGVREILAAPEWEPVYVEDHGAFVTVSGRFCGRAHSGSRPDWKGLCEDLDRIAREEYARLLKEAEPIDPPVEVEPVAIETPPAPEPPPAPVADLRDAEIASLQAENARLRAGLFDTDEVRFPAGNEDDTPDEPIAEPGPVAEPEPELVVEFQPEPEPEPVDPLAGIPVDLRSFVMEQEAADRFTVRMRRRYRALKHMQMDMMRPTNNRAFPDMTEEEIEELTKLDGMGAETLAWLSIQV